MTMKTKFPNAAFFVLVTGLLLAGFAKTLLLPKDINYYENRYACKIYAPTWETVQSQWFQNNLENALADQIPAAQRLKKAYNTASSQYLQTFLEPMAQAYPNRYLNYMGHRLFDEHLVYEPRDAASTAAAMTLRAEQLNTLTALHPDLPVHVYYIEKDTDINFETGERIEAGDQLLSQLHIPDERKGLFAVDSFDTFSQLFYKTDHHWNLHGSYEAYLQLLPLLECEDTPLIPGAETLLSASFSGSKAAGTGSELFAETFSAYPFAFPPMDITINGQPASDYGDQEGFFHGTASGLSYGAFYGGDEGEVLLDTGNAERENLLIIGESYDNALLKLLASHYHVTHAVDLRYYAHYMGTPFFFSDYVQAHSIDRVLLIGNIDFFVLDDFILEN